MADNYQKMSEEAAAFIFDEINIKKESLLCAATGSTPTLTYDLLTEKYKQSPASFDKLNIIKLDEWGGVPMNDPATCETYLQKHLIAPLHVDRTRYISFQSNAPKPETEVKRIAKELEKKGNIDICILGMGLNGHLGFNEPASFLISEAHVAELAATTKKHAMAQASKHEMKYGLTLGMQAIMHAKKILLLVNGNHKQDIFGKFLQRKITAELPATMLWMHPNVTLICDKEALPDNIDL